MSLNTTNRELAANTNLSHYRIVSKIGAGGRGDVYLSDYMSVNINRRDAETAGGYA